MEKDCVTYLAYIMDKGTNVKSIQNISIGRNHTEVFPKDLSGLSLTRIVEFRIDLVPRAAPVTKAPYRLAPSEMQELSREIQELLSKRLIKTGFVTLGCTKTGDRQLTRLDVIQETIDEITTIKERLKTDRSRQKSYVDNHKKPLEFQIGDQVLLKVPSWKGMIRFGKRGKLNPRYTGAFKLNVLLPCSHAPASQDGNDFFDDDTQLPSHMSLEFTCVAHVQPQFTLNSLLISAHHHQQQEVSPFCSQQQLYAPKGD
ncbi:hypothetical protein Tco_0471777 [Tanacetum coccineum]